MVSSTLVGHWVRYPVSTERTERNGMHGNRKTRQAITIRLREVTMPREEEPKRTYCGKRSNKRARLLRLAIETGKPDT